MKGSKRQGGDGGRRSLRILSTRPSAYPLDHPQICLVESVAPFLEDADQDAFRVTEAKDS